MFIDVALGLVQHTTLAMWFGRAFPPANSVREQFRNDGPRLQPRFEGSLEPGKENGGGMKAMIVRAPDATPEYGDFAEPIVSEGRELVTLVAAGIHPVVRSLAVGRHYGSTGAWPLIPGVDAVARTADGMLIYTGFVEPPYGTLAERMAVPATMRHRLPDSADPVAIAGGLNPGLASWMPLAMRAKEIGQLGTVLVLGATGMAGLLAIQNASILGATRVVGMGRSTVGLAHANEAGAVTVWQSGERTTDAQALATALQGTAPSLVLDFVWGAPAEATFAALERHGLDEDNADISYIQIGALAGPEAAVPASLLRSRRIRILGSGMGSASIAAIMEQLPIYMRLIAEGRVKVPTHTFPLSRASEAWIAGESGSRVVVVPG
jgi:NADPH:quinone reductase-like Zn-dependent oxidoreductase